jgi:hypothetical protein
MEDWEDVAAPLSGPSAVSGVPTPSMMVESDGSDSIFKTPTANSAVEEENGGISVVSSMLVESDGSGLFETPTAYSAADGEEKGGKGCGQNGSPSENSRFIAGAESAQSFDDPSNLEMLSGIFNTPHPFPTLESAVFHALEHSKVHADAARAAGEEPPVILTEEQAKVELVLCLDFADKFLQGNLPSYKGTMSELKDVY